MAEVIARDASEKVRREEGGGHQHRRFDGAGGLQVAKRLFSP